MTHFNDLEGNNRRAMIREFRHKRREPERQRQMAYVKLIMWVNVAGIVVVALWAISAHASTVSYSAEQAQQIVVKAVVTAYTSSVDETDDNPWETASGSRAREGVVACPSKYEFGTRVAIAGREYTCEDRMNRRYREAEHFDVWHESKAEAFAFGKQELVVAILGE